MKKLVMMLVVAGAMMLPLAAYGRAVVLVAPGFGWGYSSYWGPYPYAYGYYGYAPVAGRNKARYQSQRCSSVYRWRIRWHGWETQDHVSPAGQLRRRSAVTRRSAV